ncbi:threonylcarbamoyl-AMP synthase [Candidatus Fermentibacteria bacterium]|nr:threonylcarbamoyl-AMP synthase [Candidatus Fermentibacteria bacterium]
MAGRRDNRTDRSGSSRPAQGEAGPLTPPVLRVDRGRPNPDAQEVALAALRREDLVLYPSDTVYGILCPARSRQAVKRLRVLKGYVAQRPFILLMSSLEMAERLSTGLKGEAGELARKHWPGPLTLVLPATEEVPAWVRSEREEVAVRYPDDDLATSLVGTLQTPLISTSANRKDDSPPLSLSEVPPEIREQCSVVLDAGELCEGEPSTIVRVTGSGIQILRQGLLRLD